MTSLRAPHWTEGVVAGRLDGIVVIRAAPLTVAVPGFRGAGAIGAAHGLTFDDACSAAAAGALGVSLVTDDAQLFGAGLAESPRTVARRLRLALRR